MSSYHEYNYLYSSSDTRAIPLSLSMIVSQTGGELGFDADPMTPTQTLFIVMIPRAHIPTQVIGSTLGRLAVPRLSMLVSMAALRRPLFSTMPQVVALPHH